MSALVDALLAHPGVESVVESRIDDDWREVRGAYLRAPFVYRVSADDDAAAAKSVIAKITAEWDAGELKPQEITDAG